MTQKITDHKRIFEWLADGEWHCGTELSYMKDDRKRISELRQKGYLIEGISCDGRCNTIHKSKNLKMRRLVGELSLRSEAPQSVQIAPPSHESPARILKQPRLFVHNSILD